MKKAANILVVEDNKSANLPGESVAPAAIELTQSDRDEAYISHLAAIVEFSEDAIISTFLDGTIKSWNKASEKMFGYTANEVMGKHILLLIPPELVNEEKNILSGICNNEIIDPYETVRIKKNGERLYVSLTVSPLKDRAGNITGVSTIARDITSRKKAEAELINANRELTLQNEEKERRAAELLVANKELAFQNEEKHKRAEELLIANKEFAFLNTEQQTLFASIVNSSDDAMLTKTLDGIITSWNYGAQKIFGYSAGEIIGKHVFTLIPPMLQNEEVEIIKKIRSGEKVDHFETERIKKDGTLFNASLTISPIQDFEGNIIGASKILRDITERVKSDHELEIKEERFRALIENNQGIISLTDEALNTIYQSPSTTRITGWTADDLKVVGGINHFHPNDISLFKTAVTAAMEKPGIPQHYISRYLHKNGHYIWLEGTATKLPDESIVKGIVFNSRDVTERKEAEEALKRLHERVLFHLDNSPLGYIEWDKDNFVRTWSHRTEQIFGWSEKEIIEKHIHGFSLVYEEDMAALNVKVQQLMEGAVERNHIIVRNYTKSGKVIWCEWYNSALKDKEGKIVTFMSLVQDITERKKNEAALSESENHLRTILDAEPECVKELNSKGELLSMNPAGLAMIEADNAQQVLGHRMTELVDEKYRIGFNRLTKEVFNGKSGTFEFEVTGLKGGRRWLETHAVPLKDTAGKIINLLGVTRDITESKKSEMIIQKEKELSDFIINSLPGIFYLFDETGKFLRWNREFEIVSGYSGEEIANMHPVQFFEGDDIQLITERIGETFTKGESNAEAYVVAKDKRKTPFYFKGISTTYDDKSCLIGMGIDITERKLAEIQLNKLNHNLQKQSEELAHSNADLEQFAYVASHDLQEPLRMVSSFLPLLEKKYADALDDKAKKYIAFAVDGANRMRQIIVDLLEFSRVGAPQVDKEDVDLNKLLNQIKILLHKNIEDINAVITSERLPQLYAHRLPLHQVFQNLISNALKYSSKEIPVQIHITVKELKDHWQFAVIDNGIGIEKEYFDKIFMIFQRLHNKVDYPGTGIGLAITKKIIETQGGHIWVESEKGKGSTFYFTIKK